MEDSNRNYTDQCGDHGGRNRSDDPCGRAAGWGTPNDSGRCRIHLGTSPDGSSHEGNDFAKGNDGGPPEGSANAETHSLSADRGLFYERLDDTKQGHVDRFEGALIDRYQDLHGRDPDAADVKDLFEIAVGYVMRDYAREYMIDQMEESGNPLLEHVEMEKDGEQIEFDKPNELLDKIEGNRKEDRMQRKDKGLEEDPGSQAAAALAEGLDLHLSAEDKEALDRAYSQKPQT